MKTKIVLACFAVCSFCTGQVKLNSEPGALPHIQNAKLETVAASGGVRAQIEGFAARQSGTAWIGYAVPSVASHHTICCFDGSWQDHGCCGTCHLESEHNTYSGSRDDCDDVDQKSVAVFYRVEDKK